MTALSPLIREAWLDALSPQRFRTYVAAAGGDEERALRLYRWNSIVAGAWFPLLSLVEVTLRNGIHTAIAEGTGRDDWWHLLRLDEKTARNITTAETNIARSYGTVHPGRVVAELSLGDWVRLLGTGGRRRGVAVDYVKLIWRPWLSKRFPAANRRDMHSRAENIRRLRNRVAHHEPLLAVNLADAHRDVLAFATILSPIISAEIASVSMIPGLPANRP